MTQDEALKLARDALEALENISTALREDDVLGSDIELMLDAITTIRETLSQPDEDAIIIQYHEATIKRLEQRIKELTAQTITEEHIAKVTSDIDLAVNKALAQPVQEPVAWMHTMIDGVVIGHQPADLNCHPERWKPLYKDPTPCQTCQALARTVMMDQTAHDTTPPLPMQERYFCQRCGKRTADLATIHTCTPPQENT